MHPNQQQSNFYIFASPVQLPLPLQPFAATDVGDHGGWWSCLELSQPEKIDAS